MNKHLHSDLNIAITGLGVVGGFGCGRSDLTDQLRSPSGANTMVELKTRAGNNSVPVFQADPAPLKEVVPLRRLRRMDRFSRMVTLAAYQALAEGQCLNYEKNRIGMILATGYGANETTFRFLDGCLDYGDSSGSPLLFSGSGHSGALSNATIMLGIEGPLLTVCQPQLPVTMALSSAISWLREQRADLVLLGGGEEYTPLRGYVREVCRVGKKHKSRPRHQREKQRTTAAGEGAAFLLLTNKTTVKQPVIQRLQIEDSSKSPARLPDKAEIMTETDQRPELKSVVRHALADNFVQTDSWNYLYGSMPVAMIFNLAIAAIRLASGDNGLEKPSSDPSRRSSLYCMEPAVNGWYGLAELTLPI